MTIGKNFDLTQLTIWQWHLFQNKIFYIDCKKTNGTTMLKVADHDSMSGEHVGTTPGLICTSGKLMIWPLEALEN